MNDVNGTARLALLIDGENLGGNSLPIIMQEAEKLGAVAVRRVYGDLKSGRMKSWQKQVEKYGLTMVNVTTLTKGKNATDMKLAIEAMDMLHGRQLDGFCIASSDGDFMALASRIRANALACYGFGMKKAPERYREAFDHFFECDRKPAAEKKTPARRSSTPAPKAAAPAAAKPAATGSRAAGRKPKPATPPKLPIPHDEILTAIEAVSDPDGWARLSAVGDRLGKNIAGFSTKKHGHSTLKRLIGNVKEVESETRAHGTVFVRRRPA
jgi:uncharacterized LabA/DUF88 family protein